MFMNLKISNPAMIKDQIKHEKCFPNKRKENQYNQNTVS